jgi:hypothetical protein
MTRVAQHEYSVVKWNHHLKMTFCLSVRLLYNFVDQTRRTVINGGRIVQTVDRRAVKSIITLHSHTHPEMTTKAHGTHTHTHPHSGR